MDTTQTLTTEELSAQLDIPTRTLEWWRSLEPTPGPSFVRIGRKVVYPRTEVINWLAHHTTLAELRGFEPAPEPVTLADLWNSLLVPVIVESGDRMSAQEQQHE